MDNQALPQLDALPLGQASLTAVERVMHLADQTDACPYLPQRVYTLRFGNGFIGGARYRELLDKGYRRNGFYLYRPVCSHCQECQVLRVPVADFRRSKEQRRIWNRGQGRFSLRIEHPHVTKEKIALYRRYLQHQHRDPAEEVDEAHYNRFLVDTCLGKATLELQFREGPKLVGVGVIDRLEDALSSVYFYFDPGYRRFSLGTYSALVELAMTSELKLDYYYMGYYIAGCGSMSYKARFRPCEIKRPDERHWRRIER